VLRNDVVNSDAGPGMFVGHCLIRDDNSGD
jgi:hypothetical protein